MFIPILNNNNLSDPDRNLKIYFDKTSLPQSWFYGYPATPGQMKVLERLWSNGQMSPDQPIDINKVTKMMKNAEKKTGLLVTKHGL